MSPRKFSTPGLLVAVLASGVLAVSVARAKEKDIPKKDVTKRTSTDFLMSRSIRRGASLFDLTKVRGDWGTEKYVVLNGVPFQKSLVAQSRGGDSATFTVALDKKFDRFQAWVGTREGGGRSDVNVFRVVGDGQELYKSSEISGFAPAERINIPVKDVSSLQLIVESTGEARGEGAFAEPVFVQEGDDNPSSTSASGADAVNVSRSDSGPIEVKIGDKAVDFGGDAPLVRGNRVLVPMKPLFDQIGATYDYDPVTHNITVKRGGHRIDLTVGSTAARIDGQLVYLDVPLQTLSTATVNESMASATPTPTPTAMTPATMTTPTASVDDSTSVVPGATPNSSALKTPPSSLVKPKDTETTVTRASDVVPSDTSPVMVPLRFIAEAFDLPVGVQYF